MVIKLYDVCKLGEESGTTKELTDSKAQPGYVVYDKVNKALKVKCANGTWICIKKVGVPGKKIMSATDFNNGYIMKESVENRFLT